MAPFSLGLAIAEGTGVEGFIGTAADLATGTARRAVPAAGAGGVALTLVPTVVQPAAAGVAGAYTGSRQTG
jgi:hypothetical protein